MNTPTHRSVAAPEYLLRDGRDTRWEAHRALRREELLKKARLAIHDLGPNTSMEEIAQYAGTSKSVFYRYFHDKNGLGQALGESVLARLESRISEAARQAKEPAEVVRHMIEAYLIMVQRSPALHDFVTTQAGLGWSRPEGSDRHTATLGLFADHVASLLLEAVGTLTPAQGHLPAMTEASAAQHRRLQDYWARSVVGMVHSAAEKWTEEYEAGTAPRREVVVESLTAWIVAPIDVSGGVASPDNLSTTHSSSKE